MFLLEHLGLTSISSGRSLLTRHRGALAQIRTQTTALTPLPDSALAERADALRRELRTKPDSDLRIPALALLSEAMRRTRGLVPYDVQLLAGYILAKGELVEMATGEGKTLVAILPSFYFSLLGHGVHVATVNSYLAERDWEFTRPAVELLGATTALLPERCPPHEKRKAYAADITYGVGTEFGFDYLRDQLVLRAHAQAFRRPRFHEIALGRLPPPPAQTQRGQHYAVIDEADSVLIDEARSPLVISMGAKKPSPHPELYQAAHALAGRLQEGEDYQRDSHDRGLYLTEAGLKNVLAQLPERILPLLKRRWPDYVLTALRARHDFRPDVHYVILKGEVVIVDEFTGRQCPERTWREGLHQAIECAAGVAISEENNSEATITRPAYFRLYQRVCGMTGTAKEAADEMRRNYRLSTRVLPLHRPSQRRCLPDRVFISERAKIAAIVQETAQRHATGQPILLGTRTVEGSEKLATALRAAALPFRLLNAKQDAEEAHIIEEAGTLGALTIATNMAGRGAHIPVPPECCELGGLHVIGYELNDNARIDRQLIGRAARQGQPGSSQFFLSPEDWLLQKHAPEEAARLSAATADAHGELPSATATVFHRVQRQVEAADRHSRDTLARYDEWLNELKHAL